jgi:hypothetical protein
MKRTICLFSLVFVILIQGCSRVDCLDGVIKLEYSGFDSTELSIAVVTRFASGSKFKTLLSTDTISLNKVGQKNGFRYERNGIYINDGIDWDVDLPLANRSDIVYDIKRHHNKQTVGPGGIRDQCTNKISYHLNDQGYTTPKQMDDYAVTAIITIKK